jgi:lysophospholipase L1-like esterase
MKLRINLRVILSPWFTVVIAVSSAGQATQAPTGNQPAARPLNMLVLGDSILWGEGLKTEHKAWYQVKRWLEQNAGRPVIEKIEAHAGAVIERSSITDNYTSPNPEVNVAVPTVNDELDNALRSYAEGSKVDLVLISACGNDVDVQNLLNASGNEEIDRLVETKCSSPMERLLRKVTTSFPNASVIVTGYYPFFSERTRNDFIMKALTRRFFKVASDTPKMSSKDVLERLTANSKEWYEASNRVLAGAVRNIDTELGVGQRRVMFAKVEFPPGYSFGAKETRLWGFNRSPFRMVLVLLSFGKIVLPSNDEVRGQRTASCNEVFKRQPNETADEKKERQKRHLFCRYAALGHPNRLGSMLYTDAITNLLKTMVGSFSFSR